jgi:hypothetical protein
VTEEDIIALSIHSLFSGRKAPNVGTQDQLVDFQNLRVASLNHNNMKLLFVFLDGVGGEDNQSVVYPAVTPHMDDLLDGKIISNGHQPGSAGENIIFQNERILLPLDACPAEGLQSATGQASSNQQEYTCLLGL